MSYLRDPDRKLRGVGSIASRDAVRRRGRFARRGMGDTASTDCSFFSDGNWYVTQNGATRKVSREEAATYPACASPSTAQRVVSAPTATPRTTSIKAPQTGERGAVLSSGARTPVRAPSSPSRTGTTLQPITTRPPAVKTAEPGVFTRGGTLIAPHPSGPLRATDPGKPASQVGPALPPKTGGSGVITPGASRPPVVVAPPSSSGAKPPDTTGKPPPKATTSGGGGGGGGAVTSPSVVTQWIPPAEETAEVAAPAQTTAAPAITTKTLALVGAGIGLLYLLTRD